MPYPDNYSPAAQDRFMGRDNYAEAFAADCESSADRLVDLSSALEDAQAEIVEVTGDAATITRAIEAIDAAVRYYRQFVS